MSNRFYFSLLSKEKTLSKYWESNYGVFRFISERNKYYTSDLLLVKSEIGLALINGVTFNNIVVNNTSAYTLKRIRNHYKSLFMLVMGWGMEVHHARSQ